MNNSRSAAVDGTSDQHNHEMVDNLVFLNGIDLHYRTLGEGPVLFVVSPGWGLASVYLQHALGSLAERLRLVFVDTRGSGLSGRPSDATHMGSAEMAVDLEGLREYLGLAEIDIFGHSNGGAIALLYASLYPNRVKKLVLVDTQVLGLSAPEETRRLMQAHSNDRLFDQAIRVLTAFFHREIDPTVSDHQLESFIGQILPLYFFDPETALPLVREQLLGPISSFAFSSQLAADKSAALRQMEMLDAVSADVLIMVGRDDFICPVILSEQVHAAIPGSSLVIFERSGHFPWLEEKTEFLAALGRFLFI
jgi:proline iminopeptidase